MVHSYHETQKALVVEMTAGIEEALKACTPDIRYFHMDTKRNKRLSWKQKTGELTGATRSFRLRLHEGSGARRSVSVSRK